MSKVLFFLALIFNISFYSFSLGNPLYSPQEFRLYSSIEGGMYGPKDYLTETSYLTYTFKSLNRNKFSLRLFHTAFFPGLLSGNLNRTGAGVVIASGFEYNLKLFKNAGGLNFYIDTGIGMDTFYLSSGAGIGDRFSNGIFLDFSYMHNFYFSSDIDAFFRILKHLSINANLGIYVNTGEENPPAHIKTGVFPGFHAAEYFRMNAGGGFTLSESFVFGFYISAFISARIPY